MRCIRLKPSSLFFRLFVAASAFALGLAVWGLWPRPVCEPRTPPAAAAKPADPARAEVSIGDTPAGEAGDEYAVFEGRYENYVYGYSVEIPAGMVGLGPEPPGAQHGFVIDLNNPRSTAWLGQKDSPESYVSVDGCYNSLDWDRLDDAVNSYLSWLRARGQNVRVRSRTATRLGGLRAVRVVALYEEDGVETVGDEVVAFDDEAEPSRVYTLSLSTPRSKYERDRPALEALMKSWCLQPAE